MRHLQRYILGVELKLGVWATRSEATISSLNRNVFTFDFFYSVEYASIVVVCIFVFLSRKALAIAYIEIKIRLCIRIAPQINLAPVSSYSLA